MAKTERKNLSGAQSDALWALEAVTRTNRAYTMSTLAGYAGVGKTTVIARLVANLCADGYRVIVTTPTHKALAVIGAKINEEMHAGSMGPELRTIHSALGLKMRENDDGTLTPEVGDGGRAVVADFDVMIVDEASMLSDELFAAVIGARRKCRVVFVGDPAQLPPVQSVSGGVSAVFDPQRVTVQVRLTEVVRQALGNPIIALATHLRACVGEGRMPAITEVADIIRRLGGSQLSIAANAHHGLYVDWCSHAVRDGMDARILAFTNRAVDRYNSCVHFELHPECTAPFAAGEPAVVQDSNRELGIKNSDALTVVKCVPENHPAWPSIPAYKLTFTHEGTGGHKTVFIPANQAQFNVMMSNTFVRARAEGLMGNKAQKDRLVGAAWGMKNAFANIAHAYAMTVHKSQGATFDTVLIDWDDLQVAARRGPVQAARLMYVAVTRAASNVCILVN